MRRRVTGNASHAIRKHATIIEPPRRLRSRITHDQARTYTCECKISKFYEGLCKSLFEVQYDALGSLVRIVLFGQLFADLRTSVRDDSHDLRCKYYAIVRDSL